MRPKKYWVCPDRIITNGERSLRGNCLILVHWENDQKMVDMCDIKKQQIIANIPQWFHEKMNTLTTVVHIMNSQYMYTVYNNSKTDWHSTINKLWIRHILVYWQICRTHYYSNVTVLISCSSALELCCLIWCNVFGGTLNLAQLNSTPLKLMPFTFHGILISLIYWTKWHNTGSRYWFLKMGNAANHYTQHTLWYLLTTDTSCHAHTTHTLLGLKIFCHSVQHKYKNIDIIQNKNKSHSILTWCQVIGWCYTCNTRYKKSETENNKKLQQLLQIKCVNKQ